MIISIDDLRIRYNDYNDIFGKIKREVDRGGLIPIVRGQYATTKSIPKKVLACRIYGPSYLSFDYALSYHGLIPEAVYSYTSATFHKRRSKEFHNAFGNYYYRDVPRDVFFYGVETHKEDGYCYQIATPEKALCDKLYTTCPVKNIEQLRTLLFDDMRIDEYVFYTLNFEDMSIYARLYKCKNINLLINMLQEEKIICTQ